MSIFTKAFWRDAAERAVKTAAQFALVALGQDATQVNLFDANWQSVFGLAVSGAVVSVLFSVASSAVTTNTVSPASLVGEDG